MEQIRVGFAFCGSFCTYGQAMSALEQVKARFGDVTPIVSEASAALDTRFGAAHDHMREMERICGFTDTTVTMAAKAHLRNGAPLVLAISTNDALAASAKHIGALMDKKNVYFVPFRQDDPVGKPTSLAADFSRVNAAIEAALQGRQLQPVVLGPDQ